MDELVEFSLDTENAQKNYNLARWYENQGHTAPAHSYYLRAAERTNDDNSNLAYQALIRASFCYKSQGSRDATEKILLENALMLLPNRPEAYYFLSLLYENKQEWQNCYIYANFGLEKYKDEIEFIDVPEYQGKHLLYFQKAVSAWWWGRGQESKDLFAELFTNQWDKFDQKHKSIITDNINRLNIKIKNQSIPVIGIPIVNGVHWLKRLIESIDYPVKNLVLINNSGKSEITKELDELVKNNYNFIDELTVTHLPANIGCAGAWNLIIKLFINEPYWILGTHDIEFSPGMLKSMHDEAINTDSGMIHPKKSDWGGGAYDIFLLKDWVVQQCGLFDENLYPAYAEDVDYHIRIINEKIKISILDIEYKHGQKDYVTSGAQTWRIDPSLKDKIDNARILNESEYLTKKWGSEYQSLKVFEKPFNNSEFKTSYTAYDLEFVRKKYLGF